MNNVALIKQMYEKFNASGDVNSILDLFDPDVVWIDAVTNFGRVVGHKGFLDAMANLAAQGYVAEADPEEFEALDENTVVARGYTRLKRGDSYTDLTSHSIYVVREGKVVCGASATRRQDALDALAALQADRSAS